jgi:hypothetical protein
MKNITAKKILFFIAIPLSFFLTTAGFALVAKDSDILGKIVWWCFGAMIEVAMLYLVPDIRHGVKEFLTKEKKGKVRLFFSLLLKIALQAIFMYVSFSFSVGFAQTTLASQSLHAKAVQEKILTKIDTTDLNRDIKEITDSIVSEQNYQNALLIAAKDGYVTSTGNQIANSSKRIDELRLQRTELENQKKAITNAAPEEAEELKQTTDTKQMFSLLGEFYGWDAPEGQDLGFLVTMWLMVFGAGALEIIKVIVEEDKSEEKKEDDKTKEIGPVTITNNGSAEIASLTDDSEEDKNDYRLIKAFVYDLDKMLQYVDAIIQDDETKRLLGDSLVAEKLGMTEAECWKYRRMLSQISYKGVPIITLKRGGSFANLSKEGVLRVVKFYARTVGEKKREEV